MNYSRVKICSRCKKEFLHGEIVYFDGMVAIHFGACVSVTGYSSINGKVKWQF